MQRDIERNFGRRTFLKSAGAIAGYAALGQATHVFAATQDSRAIPLVSYLEIGGEFHRGTWIDGGGPQAPVMAGAVGPDGTGPKMNGPTRFDDIQFLLPMARSKTLWPWILESLTGSVRTGARREASLFWFDPTALLQPIFQLKLGGSVLTEIRFPGAVAAEKETAQIALRIAADQYQFPPPPRLPTPPQIPAGFVTGNSSMYQLQIQGLESETRYATRVTPPLWTRKLVPDTRLDARQSEFRLGAAEIGPLRFSIPLNPAVPAVGLRRWCESVLLRGEQNDRRPGVLTYGAANGRDDAARLGFVQLLPYKMGFRGVPGGEGLIMDIEMSVFQMTAA